MSTPLSNYASPISKAAKFARIDQGVDYSQTDPYLAIGSGTVYAIGGGFAGGTGKAVYYELDQPITINGRSYSQAYVAETTPLVKLHDTVSAGQPIATGGAAELGFANGTAPAAPLVGGLGAGTQPTQAGQDFAALVHLLTTGHASSGGGALGAIEKGFGTGANIITGGISGTFGVPSYSIPSPTSIAGDVVNAGANALGLNPSKWVKELTSWIQAEAAVGFLYVVLTLGAFVLLALSLRRATSAAPGPAGYARARGGASIAKLAAAA